MNWKPERNAAIVAMRKSGATLDAIGAAFGISRHRVGQILAKAERIEAERGTPHVELSGRTWWGVVNMLGGRKDWSASDLVGYTVADFLRLPNFWRKSAAELKAWLASNGIEMAD